MKNITLPSFNVLFALTFLCLFSFFACKKDPVPPTKEELLTAKKWKKTASTSTVDNVDYDSYADLEACEKDDLFKYNIDFTVTYDQGVIKCDPSSPQTSSAGTWVFNSDKTKLTLADGSEKLEFTIKELTATTLKVSYDFTFTFNGDITKIPVTLTYTAQ
jgi:Lipocalin-like domain